MVTQQTLQGNWNELKGKIRAKWGQLTGDELQHFDGNVERLVGMIQRKTGEGKESIERHLEELTSNGAATFAHAAEAVKDYSHQAVEKLQQTSQAAADSVRQGYDQAEKMVRQRPVESVAVVFGAGMLVGAVLGLVLRGR